MNLINYSSELSNVNLSPFKYTMCSLINTFSNKENYQPYSINCSYDIDFPAFNTHFFIYFEAINSLINTFNNESSKQTLLESISNIISLLKNKHNLSLRQTSSITNHFIYHLNLNLSKIKTLNDLYAFFIDTLVSLRANKTITDSHIVCFDSGGHIDNFLRKCLNAFNKTSFSDMISLYESILKFNNNILITTSLTGKESDLLFDKCFSSQIHKEIITNYDNFSQRYLFEVSSLDNKLKEKLFNVHKFYDHNLKYIYNDNSTTNESKIHYSLLYLTNLYYETGYYDKAIQILFECVKLSQSNCDHEALLKCFLWLSKIFIQKGNYDLASQCLSTCLIKSFQNNFQLLHLLSSIELANLNFVFDSNIGNEKLNNSLEEKILSHSNNCLHLYKNISDFYTMKDKEIKDDLNSMINFTNFHLIYNLIRKGEYSLTIEYVKIMLKEISNFNLYNQTNYEIMNNCICLLMNILEFDYLFCIKTIIEIIKEQKDISFNEYVLWIIINKYCVEYNKNENYHSAINTNIGIFYQFINEYYELYYEFNKDFLLEENGAFIEDKLQNYIQKCKQFHINAYKIKALILLSKVYMNQTRYTEAMEILNKIATNANGSIFNKTIAKINLCYCYYKLNYHSKAKEILQEIKPKVDNICSITDKYDYYYISSLYEKNETMIKKCIHLGVILNNQSKIEKAIELLNESQKQNELTKITQLLDKNDKLFSILNLYNTTAKEALEIIYIINNSNYQYITI